MMTDNAFRRALVYFCALLIACGGDAVGRAPSTRDSTGVRIVSNPAWPGADNPVVQLSDEPTLVIGGNTGGRAEEQFSYISGLFRLSDGSIAVANAGSFEVRLFDSSGKFIRSMGRAGSGPGEFQSLYGIYRLPRDSIAAFDTQLQSMTVFAPDGRVGRTFSVTGSPAGSRVTPAGVLGTGRDANWLMLFAPNSGMLERGQARMQLFLARYDQKGALRDTIARLPGFEVFVHDAGKGRVVPTVLYGWGVAVATADDGFLVAASNLFEINRYTPDGRIESITRHAVKPRTVSAQDIADARAAQLLLFRSPEQKALLREAHIHMPVPLNMPAIGSTLAGRAPWIVVNESGGFWVLNFQAPSDKRAVWSIFDRGGRMHGNISLPESFALYEVGKDYILGVRKDSLEVEQVLIYGLSGK